MLLIKNNNIRLILKALDCTKEQIKIEGKKTPLKNFIIEYAATNINYSIVVFKQCQEILNGWTGGALCQNKYKITEKKK